MRTLEPKTQIEDNAVVYPRKASGTSDKYVFFWIKKQMSDQYQFIHSGMFKKNVSGRFKEKVSGTFNKNCFL